MRKKMGTIYNNQAIIGQTIEEEERQIASRLHRLRCALNVEISDLSFFTKIDEDTLRSYERAQMPIFASDLILIADAFGVSFDYFYGNNDIEYYNATPMVANHEPTKMLS